MSWNSSIKPLVKDYLSRLLNEFEKQNIIKTVKDDSTQQTTYELGIEKPNNPETFSTTTTTTIQPTSNRLFTSLFELRNLARAVYSNLNYPDSKDSNHYKLSKILEKLEENGAFKVAWKDRRETLDTLDKIEALSNDPSTETYVETELTANGFNIDIIISEILRFFGTQIAHKSFLENSAPLSQLEITDKNDLITLSHPKLRNLSFFFRLRRVSPIPDNQMLFEAINVLQSPAPPSFVFIVIFTNENQSVFDKLQFQFKQILINDFAEYNQLRERIKFIPIWTMAMGQLDIELDNFKKTYIQDRFKFEFKNQPPPRGFRDRNDHFLERDFEFKKSDFKITITPVNTSYWRLGFRFIQTNTFPPLTQGRHENPDVADIHICVGNAEEINGELKWKEPYSLNLENYHVEIINDSFIKTDKYTGEPVILYANSNHDGSIVEFIVKLGDTAIGRRTYNLSQFRFCRIAAWCDQNQFELVTVIKIKHRGLQS